MLFGVAVGVLALGQAVKWYRMAALHGYAVGPCNFGGMCHKGEGVPDNIVTAYAW